jgi:hypothetical protein
MRNLVLLIALAIAGNASAQNIVKFFAGAQTGVGQVIPVLNWCTETGPNSDATKQNCTQGGPAIDCTASGSPAWSGTKAPQGTATLPPITVDVTYALSCRFPGDQTVTFRWTPATTNTDGSAYVKLGTTQIKYTFNATLGATDACNANGVICVDLADQAPRPSMHTASGITQVGTLRALAFHISSDGVASVASNPVSKVFSGNVNVQQSVKIVVQAQPSAPGGFSAT